MSALRSLSILMLITAMGAESLLTSEVYAQTSTRGRKPANPKASKPTKPAKPAPIRRPVTPPPASGTFAVPQIEEDNWYNLEKSEDFYTKQSTRPHQVGVIGVLNLFGSGAGAEYIYSFGTWGIGASALFTTAELDDTLSTNAAGEAEAVEFFETKSRYLRVHGRYNFFRFIYAGVGVSADNIEGSYGWKGSAINAGEIKTDFSSNVMMADIFVGSEFRGPWGTYFGIDWLGTSLPFSSSTRYDENPDLDLTSSALKGHKPDQRISDEINAQLRIYYLNLRVGLTF